MQIITDPEEANRLEDGIYDGISGPWIHPAAYHAITSRHSRSELIALRSSERQWDYYRRNGPRKVTGSMLRGEAVHAAILEPERFHEYAIEPDFGPKNRNPGKQLAAEWKASLPEGVSIVPKPESLTVDGILASIGANPNIVRLLQSGTGSSEVSVLWTESVAGMDIPMRARIDRRVDYNDGTPPLIVDLKGCPKGSTVPAAWNRKLTSELLHIQAACYLRGMSRATGVEHRRFVWVAWESEPPFDGGLFECDEASLDIGLDEYISLVARLDDVLQKPESDYNDHTDRVYSAGLSGWYRKAFERGEI